MYILDVIPTIRVPRTDIQLLSYFCKELLTPGALVRIPLGSRKINALVVYSHDLEKQRTQIKQSRFQIKNISGVISKEPILNEKQLQLLKYLSDYYFASPALFAAAMIPNYLINKKTPVTLSCHSRENGNPGKSPDPRLRGDDNHSPLLIKKDDRAEEYEAIIHSTLSDGKQILLLAPELAQAKYYEQYFAKQNPIILTSELSPKKFFQNWDKIRTGEAKFIIGTRTAAFANFHSLGAIIIDEEHSREYKSRDMLPYYNAKTVAFKIARSSGARIIMGSATPSFETYTRAKTLCHSELVSESEKILKRVQDDKKARISVIDMRNEFLDKNYSSFSYRLKSEMKSALEDKSKKIILFSARRGNQSFYFCADCKHIEKCPRCDAHLVYHSLQKNILLCHHCGFRKEPALLCSKCKSHNIKTFGAGTQKIAEEIKKTFGVTALAIDSDIAPTFQARQKIIEKFNAGESPILVGTGTLLNEPNMPKADLLGIISLDNLLYIPDYKIGEQIFQTVRALASYAKPGVPLLWQTYTQDNETIQKIALLDYDKFYESEIAERENLRYPPFSRIIKIAVKEDNLPKTEARSAKIARYLNSALQKAGAQYEILGPVPAYVPKIKNRYIFIVILKIFSADQKELNKIFAPIQNEISIDVDPENII